MFDTAVRQLVDALRSLGVKSGEILLVHSDTDMLSTLLPDVDPLGCFRMLETALSETVGPEGTFLVPTFTYSFCHGRKFDPVKRNSATGLFSNYIRRRDRAYRSHHPVFSFAAMGAKAEEITKDVSVYGFGVGSVFERLMQEDGKIICINVPFQECCTFVHHIEEICGVDYRYHKEFLGKIVIDGVEQDTRAVNYVRDLERNVVSDFDAFAALLTTRQILKSAAVANGEILLYPCRDTFEAGVSAIGDDPFFLLAAPPASSDEPIPAS